MITIKIENENYHSAGWLASHLGLKKDCLELSGIHKESFDSGFKMRCETANMEDPNDDKRHGGCHIAFLMESTNEFPHITWKRHKVSIEENSSQIP